MIKFKNYIAEKKKKLLFHVFLLFMEVQEEKNGILKHTFTALWRSGQNILVKEIKSSSLFLN